MRRAIATAACAVFVTALAIPAQAGPMKPQKLDKPTEYVVLYKEGVSVDRARDAVRAAGGTIVTENTDVGVATVRTSRAGFVEAVRGAHALDGAAANRMIGRVPKTGESARRETVERMTANTDRAAPAASRDRSRGEEPLAGLQWDMKQIHATPQGSYGVEQGSHRVLVGMMDTRMDASHPDIAPNFNRSLSRNFTTDIEEDANGEPVDGPCAEEADRSCNDPATVDENDHGTHTASTVGSPRNDLGIAGVAPKISLVNLRVGQDSGFFFLQPTVNALTYAGRNGIDVVNMSFFIDPWLWNCPDNPADSPADQLEQRTVIEAAQRALDFARARGVTLINSAGNELVDYTKTNIDEGSPNFASEPGEEPRRRTIPASCTSMPSEGNGVIATSATSISTRKSFYSSFGVGHADISAPGGDTFDTPDMKADPRIGVWAAYPESLARERDELNPDGTPKVPNIVRDCRGGTCAYYQSIQGTSMAAPHAVGVAALIISRFGRSDRGQSGLTLDPRVTERILRGTTTPKACPSPRTVTYVWFVRQPDGSFVRQESTQTCEGTTANNGFFGNGIVDALRAVRH